MCLLSANGVLGFTAGIGGLPPGMLSDLWAVKVIVPFLISYKVGPSTCFILVATYFSAVWSRLTEASPYMPRTRIHSAARACRNCSPKFLQPEKSSRRCPYAEQN